MKPSGSQRGQCRERGIINSKKERGTGILEKAHLGSSLPGSLKKTLVQTREPQPFLKCYVSEK